MTEGIKLVAKWVRVPTRKPRYVKAESGSEPEPDLLDRLIDSEEEDEERRTKETRERHLLERIVDESP